MKYNHTRNRVNKGEEWDTAEDAAKKSIAKDNLEKNLWFFNRWATHYDLSIFQYWMKKFHVPVFAEITGTKNKILDVSCGTGELLKSIDMCRNGKDMLVGLDMADEMLTVARNKLPKTIKLIKGDVHALPFKDNSFDYVLSTEAFHHYHSQEKALSELKRVAKRGGKVIIVDINFFFRPIHALFEMFEPGCVRINSKSEMASMMSKAGLAVTKQQRSFLFAVMNVGVKR